MPSYNGGFPATYQPMGYPGYFTPQPQPQMMQQPVQQPAPQMMSPPTIRAEIVQVDGEEAARAFPVGAGASQMMIAKDDSAIYVKSALPNGTTTLDVYVRRPPAPPSPVFDPEEYVRKDEIESLVAAAVASQTAAKKARKETVEDEPF